MSEGWRPNKSLRGDKGLEYVPIRFSHVYGPLERSEE
jgi:hypothetical protein